MSNHSQEYIEAAKENLDSDLIGHIVADQKGCRGFLIHIENMMHPEMFTQLIDGWIKTPIGQTWYERQIERIVDREVA